ncbi:zinc finger protein 91-like [Oppia nitens]|uniref:zinc finger protein 91-like n=1 Tax=Oppia nitens TaxID=1686743 RepID=UPI0023DA7EF5|nr:zinc finger protein 91-like [Oppia nitens]
MLINGQRMRSTLMFQIKLQSNQHVQHVITFLTNDLVISVSRGPLIVWSQVISRLKDKKKKDKTDKCFEKSPIDGSYHCTDCHYRTTCPHRMTSHMICHTDRRPFKCHYYDCDLSFKRISSLKRHVKTLHLKERLYECRVCGKRYAQSQSLKDHSFVHLSVKSFKCDINGCDKWFQTPKYLRSHKIRGHSVKINDNKTVDYIPDTVTNDKQTHGTDADIENKLQENVVKIETNPIIDQKSTPELSDTVNVDINSKLLTIVNHKCVIKGCGKTFHLYRSLRSHYKYTHSDQYDNSSKTVHLLATDDNNSDNNTIDFYFD